MNTARAMGFCIVQFFASLGWAQDLLITTYAGPGLPVGGTAADKQAIEPSVVVADGKAVANSPRDNMFRENVPDR
jgi:hypothetical protein